jgi:hypothetical protein
MRDGMVDFSNRHGRCEIVRPASRERRSDRPSRRNGRKQLPIQKVETISNGLKIFIETSGRPAGHPAGGPDMTIDDHFKLEQVRIARYRNLEREVTDPLAQCLLHMIVEELEEDLEDAQRCIEQASTARLPI